MSIQADNLKTNVDITKYAIIDLNDEEFKSLAKHLTTEDEVTINIKNQNMFVVLRKVG